VARYGLLVMSRSSVRFRPAARPLTGESCSRMRAGLGRLESNVVRVGAAVAPWLHPQYAAPGGSAEHRGAAQRVPMYAGIDSLTGRRHYLKESIPACPSAHVGAQKVMRRLTNQVDERCNLSDQRNGRPVA
jgi:hypothetical protein